jgi:hypothetical protein
MRAPRNDSVGQDRRGKHNKSTRSLAPQEMWRGL